jgi:hypothetical protein
VIAARRLQRSFADGLIAEEVKDLWEPWMRHADRALNDDQLPEIIREELSRRCKKSKTRGRPSTVPSGGDGDLRAKLGDSGGIFAGQRYGRRLRFRATDHERRIERLP